jgi:hypothetical protein
MLLSLAASISTRGPLELLPAFAGAECAATGSVAIQVARIAA